MMKIQATVLCYILFHCLLPPTSCASVLQEDEDKAVQRIFQLIEQLTTDGTIRNVSRDAGL